MKYVADDGKEFTSEADCIMYEQKIIAKEEYWKEFVSPPLAERARRIIEKFYKTSRNVSLGDDDLAEKGYEPRYNGEVPLVGEWKYGIAYLRDDAVSILISYIEELKRRNDLYESFCQNA